MGIWQEERAYLNLKHDAIATH